MKSGGGFVRMGSLGASSHRRRRRLRSAEGAQLLEFALVLPLLVVLVVGAADFGAAWALKDKLTNAAREGARIGVSQPDDLSQGSPPASVTAVRSAVANYLTNAGVTTCAVSSSATAGSYGKYSYSSSSSGCGNFSLVVERAYTFTSTLQGTRVTLSYPFAWNFGHIIKLLVPSSSYGNSLTISTSAVMQNLT